MIAAPSENSVPQEFFGLSACGKQGGVSSATWENRVSFFLDTQSAPSGLHSASGTHDASVGWISRSSNTRTRVPSTVNGVPSPQ